MPSQSSPGWICPSPHRLQLRVSKTHVAAQRSVPDTYPSVEQVCPPRSRPSHCSEPSRTALPQSVQAVVSNAHSGEHARAPPSKPCVRHVWPSRFVPSHSSSRSTKPSPHTPETHPPVSNVHAGEHASVPP